MCTRVPKFSLSAEGGGPPITISAGNAKLRRQILSLTASISAMQFSFHKSAPGHKICYASNLVWPLSNCTYDTFIAEDLAIDLISCEEQR